MARFPKKNFISDISIMEKYFVLFFIHSNDDMREVIGYLKNTLLSINDEEAYKAINKFEHELSNLINHSISMNVYTRKLIVNPKGTIEKGCDFILDNKFQYVFRCKNKEMMDSLLKKIQKIHRELL